MTYTQFKDQARQGTVAEVTIRRDQIRGRYRSAEPQEGTQSKESAGENTEGKAFTTTKPQVEGAGLLDLLEAQGVTFRGESPEVAWWQWAIASLLPWLLILGVVIFLMRRMQQRMTGEGGGPGGIFGFAKSKAKRFRQEATTITLNDVAGLENAKQDLREIIDTSPARSAIGPSAPRSPRACSSSAARSPSRRTSATPPPSSSTTRSSACCRRPSGAWTSRACASTPGSPIWRAGTSPCGCSWTTSAPSMRAKGMTGPWHLRTTSVAP